MPHKTKICTKCGEAKPLTEFTRDRSKRDGLRGHCKPCVKKQYQKYYTPDKKPQYKDRELQSRYGIGLGDYQRMLAEQDGCCAICRRLAEETADARNRLLCVDHCHTTGEVRGLLCRACNLVLGYAADSPQTLRDAAKYLER